MSAACAAGLPALVGRELELGVLAEAMREAREGRGRAVFLIGEDGIGKSRLVLAAAEMGHAAGMRVLCGRASRVCPTMPLRPLVEALAATFRDGRGPTEQSLGPYRAMLSWLIPEYGSGDPASATPSPVLLAEAVLRLLSVAGTTRRCLLVLEDLNDADAQTLAIVEYLADNIAEQGTVLLVTACQDPGAVSDLAHALAHRHSSILLRLSRLDREEVRRLVAADLRTDPAGVPEEVLDELSRDSAGNPFVARELLRAMVDSGRLASDAGGYRLVAEVPAEIPATVGRRVAQRAARLGPAGYRLLSTAAAIGERFPLSVLQRTLGISESDTLGHLRLAVAAGLITAGGPSSDWYGFRDRMTLSALLSQLTAADRAGLARQAATAAGELHPGLPGHWCEFAAALTLSAGDRPGAARLFANAGRRALAAGLAEPATGLLEQAWELLDASADGSSRGDVLSDLLAALAVNGQVERGLQFADRLDELGRSGAPAKLLATLHTRLAWLAVVGGRQADGLVQVNAALAALGPRAPDRDTAQVDAVAAHLLAHSPESAEQLATQAAEKADRAGLPAVACAAWRIRGVLARQRGSDEATACFARVRTLADEHHLPQWRMHASLLLGEDEWLAGGETATLLRVREQSLRAGAIVVRHAVDARLALDHVLRGDFPAAERIAAECTAEAERLGLADNVRHQWMTRSVCAAHQGRRAELSRAMAGFRRQGGRRSPLSSLALGLAGAVCALLEEDRDLARQELAEAVRQDAERSAPYPLVGQHGLALLLDVLPGGTDRPYGRDVGATAASHLRWNHQFTLLARAVRLGRLGRSAEAAATVAAAQDLAQPYPMALHLGLRLVAEAAHADHWGDPVTWLRRAAEHFHHAQVPAVAGACRALLRQIGVVIPHRRAPDRVPPSLRLLGVTEREYEVLQLLAGRRDNRSIAAALFISHRTVEKHVASLVVKTGAANRAALDGYPCGASES